MKERSQIKIKLIVSHILLIIGVVVASLFCTKDSYLLITIAQTILLILFLAGYWEFFGLKFKWIFSVSLEMLILFSLIYRLNTVITEIPGILRLCLMGGVQLYLLWQIGKIIMVIFNNDKESMEIEFPFKEGRYLITDGGNSKTSRLMNYHFHSPVHKRKNTNRSMLYATDTVKLSDKSSPFMPKSNEEYAIYGEKIFSPMEGTVLKMINDIDDNSPFSGNYPYNTGNTVVIKKDQYYFLLGHLKKGSIVVKEGDIIKSNDLLGAAGNSGMSERPHLHMQLMKSDNDDYWKGMGICIRYKNKDLYKNRLIEV